MVTVVTYKQCEMYQSTKSKQKLYAVQGIKTLYKSALTPSLYFFMPLLYFHTYSEKAAFFAKLNLSLPDLNR